MVSLKINLTDILRIIAEMELGSRVQNDAIRLSPNDYYLLLSIPNIGYHLNPEKRITRLYGLRLILDVNVKDGSPELCNYSEYINNHSARP